MDGTKRPIGRDDVEGWLLEPMIGLAGLLKEKTGWTWQHSGRVARYAVALGKHAGLDRMTMLALQYAALLHDIGKITLATGLLDKPTQLTRDEWFAITKHSTASSHILKSRNVPTRVVTIAQSHHEWYNGKGYPFGLEAEAIPLGARILSLAEAYDAMTSDRPYRLALSREQIAAEIERGSGEQFDPYLVSVLRPLLGTDLSALLPPRTLRVISDDPALYRQLWFAAYPLGWEIQPFPLAWTVHCPEELVGSMRTSGRLTPDLTLVDGRSVRRIPEPILSSLPEQMLWLDPTPDNAPAIYRPLDLMTLFDHLNPEIEPDDSLRKRVEPLRVFIADPYQLFRQALRQCLEERFEMIVVGEAKTASEYRLALAHTSCHVSIIASDLLDGTQTTTGSLSEDHLSTPHEMDVLEHMPTVVLVADEDLDLEPSTFERRRAGQGLRRYYIARGAPVETLVEAVKTVLADNKTRRLQEGELTDAG